MKVKIQVTVEMEDVPKEVNSRLSSIITKYENSCVSIKNAIEEIDKENYLSAIKKIDEVRKNLTFFDSTLEDSYNILTGYMSYKTKELEKTLSTSEPEKVEGNE